MATVFTANSSGVLVDGQAVPGVLGIDYQVSREQNEIYALGSDERVAVYYGARRVAGRIRVASANPDLDRLTTEGVLFQIVANLRHSESSRSVAFDDCFIESKDFSIGTGGHGETVYTFRSTRVREEDGGGGE